MTTTDVYFVTDGNQTKKLSTPVFDLEALKGGMTLAGPAIILNQTSTILVEPGCQAEIDSYGSVIIEVKDGHGRQDEYLSFKTPEEVPFDPIELSIFGHRFMSIAEQMGITLQRTAVSTNIKERLDFSCALFDPEGNLVANAPHLPVHLGSM
jgi:5-oxoprolinase (ATP-hydrolysing)